MKIRLLLVSTLLFVLIGCSGGKKAQQAQIASQPEWVKMRPSSPTYYYGIGAVRKSMDVSQYQQAARQNALADMAGEISTTISSNSVLHAFESNLGFREDFTSTIRAQTQQDLEGYELVDSWEDLENYWVYYRLSKARYQELKEQRKNDAVSRSFDYFTSGLGQRDQGNIRMAIVQLVKALEPIKSYFSEPLPVELNGQQIFLGNEIFKELSTTISHLQVVPINREVSIKTGQALTTDQLLFETRFPSFGAVSDIPLVAQYSEKPIRNNKQRSSAQGQAQFEVDVVRSSKTSEVFSVTIDMDEMLAEAGADPLIRRLVNRFVLSQGATRINIQKPKFAIISNEIMLGEPQKPGILEASFKQKAVEAGYVVITDGSDVDFTVRITAVASPRDDTGQFKNVAIAGQLSVENDKGVKIYQRSLEGFIGRHFDYKQAGEDAFRDARRRLESTFFREIQEAVAKR